MLWLIVNITGKWLEKSSSIVLIVFAYETFERKMSISDGLQFGCLYVKVGLCII